MTKTGRPYGGRSFVRGQIYRLLSNPIYLGEIAHKGVRYDGQHKAIIERALWEAVQAKITTTPTSVMSAAMPENRAYSQVCSMAKMTIG